MGRSPCCAKEGLNRGAWTAVEDKILTDYITAHGDRGWRNLPKRAGLMRCGKSCRLRWLNYLRPDIKRGNISEDEEELIIRLHKLLGNRWSLIAGRLPGRTDNEIKNYWNTTLCKKVQDTTKLHKILEKQKPTKSSSGSEPRVIRTKAFRCAAKVCINEQSIDESQPLLIAAETAFGFEDDMPTLDFLLDFDFGDLGLSDPEFSLQQYHHVLSSPEEIMLPESTVKGTGDHHSDSSCSDFLSFTSFLDCQDEHLQLHEDQI